MREIFMSGSVRGLIVTSGLLPQQEVRYGLYSTVLRQGFDPVIDDGVLANISPFQEADLLAYDFLNKNQLKKGKELLAEYKAERQGEK
jgi:hypothetical protein